MPSTTARTRPATTQAQPRPPSGAPADAEHRRILSTLNEDGTRRWIKPKPASGPFLRARRIVAWALIALFTILPHVRVGGRPIVLLDVINRRYAILGFDFLPTDTLLLALFMIGLFLSIFLITALFGRVWCGWACPQSVYMEFVFRPLERFFTGTPGRQPRKGTLSGWLQTSGWGKPARLATYFLVSCFLAHTFLAYFIGVDRLWMWVQRSPFEHPIPFVVMAAVTALMMFDFTYFREQTCIIACPYGRFQSALLDRDSMIISYNRARGEPRGRATKHRPLRSVLAPTDASIPHADAVLTLPVLAPSTASTSEENRPVGDCVDCGLCVTCCPTGIDIRNGLQMECIGCAQCIDACNNVMAKLGRAPNLIRYSSQAIDAGRRAHLLRARTVIYPLALLLIVGVFLAVLSTKTGTDVLLMRGPGAPHTRLEGGMISNPLKVRLVNRTSKPATYELAIVEPGIEPERRASIRSESLPVTLGPGEDRMLTGLVLAPADRFRRGRLDLTVHVRSDSGMDRSVAFRMLGPGSSRSGQTQDAEEGRAATTPGGTP